jgi:hypothetical protein
LELLSRKGLPPYPGFPAIENFDKVEMKDEIERLPVFNVCLCWGPLRKNKIDFAVSILKICDTIYRQITAQT